jgi:hypothetical protein
LIKVTGTRRWNFSFLTFAVTTLVFLFGIASSARRFFGDDFCAYSARFFSDGCLALSALDERTVLTTSIDQAKSQDRFYQVVFYSLTQIVLASGLLTSLVKVLMTVAICWFTFRIASWFLGERLGLLSVVLFIATYPLLGYNTLTNLPGWFNFGALGFLVFLDQFLRIFVDGESVGRSSMFLFYIGFLVSLLSYEMYVGISAVLLLVLAVRRIHLRRVAEVTWSSWHVKHYWILWVSIGLYLVLYVTFMLLSSGTYSGTEVGIRNPLVILSTLALLSLGAIPLSLFSGIQSLLIGNDDIEITGLVSVDSISWVILLIGSVFVFLTTYCITDLSRTIARRGLSRFRWLLLISLIFLPNFLLSLTQRYRDWSLSYPFYLTTFNSHIFVCIASVALLARVMARGRSWRVVCVLLFLPILLLSTLSKASYLAEAIQFDERLHVLGSELRGTPPSGSPEYVELDKEIGAFPYRFSEVYIQKNP